MARQFRATTVQRLHAIGACTPATNGLTAPLSVKMLLTMQLNFRSLSLRSAPRHNSLRV